MSAGPRKLRSRSWAVVGQRPITAADGKSYQTAVVDADTIPMWLATIADLVKARRRRFLPRRANSRVLAAGVTPTEENIHTGAAWMDGFLIGVLYDRLQAQQDGSRRKATLK